ncbi:hypothetical protein D3C72_860350 [compost metagenome]
MARRDLDHARAERAVHVFIGNDRNLAVGQRQVHELADQVRVALVLGVDHHGGVAEHGFRARGGHGQVGQAVHGVRLGQRVVDVPERAFLFHAVHFQVGHGRAQHRVPVDQALAAVDQALFEQADEHLGHGLRHLGRHREVLARPVDRRPHAAHLARDGGARLLLPLPDLLDELFAAEVMARHALGFQLALHHDLRGDTGVVGTRHPQRVGAAHARVARQAVHDGLVERVAHVQRAGHIGRRQLDGEIGAIGVHRGLGDAAALPFGAPFRLDGGGFEALGKGLVLGGHAWGCRGMRVGAGRWAD